MTTPRFQHLMAIVTRLSTDYADYAPEGEGIVRWADPDQYYPDCSGGCRWNNPLWDTEREIVDDDWLICMRPDGPRRGMLTFEHQAGLQCFEIDPASDSASK